MTSAPKVRVNNYTRNKKISMNVLSKIYIILEFLVGLNRVNVFGIKNLTFKTLTCLYSVSIIVFLCYYTFYTNENWTSLFMKLIQYIVYTIFGFATRNKLEQFYNELQHFDEEVGITPTITRGCLNNLLQTAFVVAFTLFTICEENLMQCAILYLIHVLENQYYSHLLLLLIQRLRVINWCVKSSLINTEIEKLIEVEKFSANGHQIKMTKLMDFYCIIVNAYELLTDAIKRQVKINHRFLMMLLNLLPFD